MNQFNIFDCLGEGWEKFKVNAGLAIAGMLLFNFISMIGSYFPILNIFYTILIAPAFAGGAALFGLNLARNSNPRIDDIFAGFKRFGPLLGGYWLLVLGYLVGMLPSALIGIVTFFGTQGDPGSGLIAIFLINAIVVAIWLMRYTMLFFIIMDDPEIGPIEAMKESAWIMRGHIPMVIVFGIFCAIIAAISILFLVLPYILLVAPWLAIAWARVFIRMREAAEGAITTDSESAPVVG